MKRAVCVVFDSAVNLYGQPIFVPSVGAALRSFIDEVNNRESAMCAHPEDYVLSTWLITMMRRVSFRLLSVALCPLLVARMCSVMRRRMRDGCYEVCCYAAA